MLARIWSGPETTAIWCELVAARKKVLQQRLESNEFNISCVNGSRIEIPRAQLAEWDASARSWLRSADKAKLRQQTQLMLIIDNIGMHLTSKPQVYETVLPVWVKAMTTMESIVSGVAQVIRSPEVVLGLSSWHIYPDMYVLGSKPQFVLQSDDLVPESGQITLGLGKSESGSDSGLSWSMPLARLRYYGRAVTRERSIGSKSTRVAFRRIVQVALGSAISAWNVPITELASVCQFLIILAEKDEVATGNSGDHANGWLALLRQEVHEYLREKEAARKESERYISLGCRRYSSFLAGHHPAPMFGLSDFQTYLSLLDAEGQIAAIRELAMSNEIADIHLEGAIIRYYPYPTNWKIDAEQDQKLRLNLPEIATVYPCQLPKSPRRLHRRWIAGVRPVSLEALPLATDVKLDDGWFEALMTRRSIEIMQSSGEPCGFLGHDEIKMQVNSDPSSYWNPNEDRPFLIWEVPQPYSKMRPIYGGSLAAETSLPQDKCELGWQLGTMPHSHVDTKYRFLFGTSRVKSLPGTPSPV